MNHVWDFRNTLWREMIDKKDQYILRVARKTNGQTHIKCLRRVKGLIWNGKTGENELPKHFLLCHLPFLCQSRPWIWTPFVLRHGRWALLRKTVLLGNTSCALGSVPVSLLIPFGTLLLFRPHLILCKTLAPWIQRVWGRMEHAQRLGHSKPCPVRNSQKNSRCVTEARKSWPQKSESSERVKGLELSGKNLRSKGFRRPG